MRLINTHDQLVAAGGGVAIMPSYTQGRGSARVGWGIYRVDAAGKQIVTDSEAPWYNYGRKVFYSRTRSHDESLEEAKAWVAERCNEPGPWHRNHMRDYVPERIAKQFPIRRTP